MGRALLASGLAWPFTALGAAAAAGGRVDERILVVFEMSGGNDGLNTVVPYADDTYHRLRPHIGIAPQRVRRIDDRFGFNPGMSGFEHSYKDGRLAIAHGCGYDQPNFLHLASMASWYAAAPNSGEQTDWAGRLADGLRPGAQPGYLVNIAASQSLAVRARRQVPAMFDETLDDKTRKPAAAHCRSWRVRRRATV